MSTILAAQGRAARGFAPLVASLGLLVSLELLVRFPVFWYVWLGISLTMVVGVMLLLTNVRLLVPGWWHTFFTPMVLVASAVGLILFLNTEFTRQITVAFTVTLSLLFWENIWRYYWASERYHSEALENTSMALNMAAVWFSASFFLHVAIDPTVIVGSVRAWILPLAAMTMVVIVFLLDYQTLWVQRYQSGRVWLLLVTQALVVGELFWLVNFLPHRIEVKAFLIVLAYYLFTNVGRSYLDGTLVRSVLRRYFYVASVSLLAILATAQWLV